MFKKFNDVDHISELFLEMNHYEYYFSVWPLPSLGVF